MANFETFTLKDIRDGVRRKLGDESYDGDTIDEQANNFQFEVFNDNRIRFMEENATIDVAQGDTSADFPDDFMTQLSLITIYGTQFFDITKNYVPYADFMRRYANFSVATPSRVNAWTDFGGGMRFAGPSSSTFVLSLDYMRTPAYMESDQDESEFPINYKEMAILGTTEKIMRVEEDFNEADFEYARLASLRTSFIRNYGRGSIKVGPSVIRTNRRRRGSRYVE